MKTCKDIIDIDGHEICAGEKNGGIDCFSLFHKGIYFHMIIYFSFCKVMTHVKVIQVDRLFVDRMLIQMNFIWPEL